MPTKSQNVSGFGPPEESPAGFGPPEDETPEPKKFVPGSLSQQQMDAAWMKKMKSNPPAKSNKPAPFLGKNDADRFKVHVSDDFQENAPAILGVAGAAVGSLGGPVGSVLGATYGGYAGKGIQRDYEEKPRSATAEALGGVEQGAYELGGQVGGRVLGRLARPVIEKYPELFKVLGLTEDAAKTSPKAVGHLTAAASPKGQAGPAKEAIAGTIGDIEQGMNALPPGKKTVSDFLDAVNTRKTAMNAESDAAMAPIRDIETYPKGIIDRLSALEKNIPIGRNGVAMTKDGDKELKAISAAKKEFQKQWSFHNLDLERVKSRARMDKFHAKESVDQYTALKANRSLEIDNAIEKGLKETVYSEMDRAAGKPDGYFADLKGRQSNLISLQKILENRISDLSGAQAISEVTPRLSTENVSLSMHPTSMPSGFIHGVSKAINPPRELTQAGKHVAKAFPAHGAVNSLPYQILFSNAPRVVGPLSKQLQDMRSHPSQ